MKTTRKQRMATHRAEMTARRQRQHARTVGFTPMPNSAIQAAFKVEFAALMIARGDAVAKGLVDVQTLRQEALRTVTRTLPAPRQVFDWAKGAVSKNNDPTYRKAVAA